MMTAEPQHRRAVPDGHDQHDEQERNGQEDVDDAHHRRVDNAAGQPGDRTPQHADHDADGRGGEPDLERGLAALHQQGELVEALVVGPEREARACGGRSVWTQVGVDGVAVIEERAEEAEHHEEQQDPDSDYGELVLRELAEREPPAALDGTDLAAFWRAVNVERGK